MLAVLLDEVEVLAAVAFDLAARFFLLGGDGGIDQPAAALEERLAADLAAVGGDVFVAGRVVVVHVAAEEAAAGRRSALPSASLPRKPARPLAAAAGAWLAVCSASFSPRCEKPNRPDVSLERIRASLKCAARDFAATSRTSLVSSARNEVYGVRMPCSVASATSSFTSSSLRPLRSSSSMISPTRRVAQSLATKAFVSSSLLSTRSAGKSNDFFVVADFAGELHLGVAAGAVAADEHDLVAGEQVELALRDRCG